jgi:hypothetical protein
VNVEAIHTPNKYEGKNLEINREFDGMNVLEDIY